MISYHKYLLLSILQFKQPSLDFLIFTSGILQRGWGVVVKKEDMAVINNPQGDLVTCYRPIIYRTEQVSAIPLLYALCTVTIDGVGHTIKKAPFEVVGTTYRFEFDLAQILVGVTAPLADRSTMFPLVLYAFQAIENTDATKYFVGDVQYYQEDPVTGLPTLTGLGDSLSGPRACITTVQQDEDYQLERFQSPLADWLSWGLDGETVGPDDYRPATYVTDGQPLSYVRINGPLLVVPRDIELPYLLSRRFRTIDLGPKALADGAGVPITTLEAGYTVQLGYYTEPENEFSFVQTHKEISFKYSALPKCNSTRLVFLNRLGGAEVLEIGGRIRELLAVSSTEARTPLPFNIAASQPFNVSQRGRRRLQVEAVKTAELSGQLYTEDYTLLEDLRTSPEVYIQEGKNLQAVTIVDAELLLGDTNELATASVTLRFAQDRIIQR